MNFLNSRISRAALACAASAIALATQSAAAGAQDLSAQTQIQVPMNDVNCPHPPGFGTPDCIVDGTRNVTLQSVTRTPSALVYNGLVYDEVAAHYLVAFDGKLHVDGLPISTVRGVRNSLPWDYDQLFAGGNATVELSAQYEGDEYYAVLSWEPTEVDSNPAYLSTETNFTTDVRAINVDYTGSFQSEDDTEFTFSLAAADPTAVLNGNSVALSGQFNNAGDAAGGALQFGNLSGTATLLTGNVLTPYPEGAYGSQNAYLSNFGLVYDVTAEVTTSIDADGVITPKIAVTDGIEMNGSKITGLGAGTAPTDAVNVSQLNDVGAVANQALAATRNIAVNNQQGPAPTATGNGAVAAGSGTTADGKGAISLGLGNSAAGDGAVAIGDPNVATGTGAVAIGANNTATGAGAVAIGASSTAAFSGNVALGRSATASGPASIAVGFGSEAAATRSVALGAGAQATGTGSVALGVNSIADQANTVSVGQAGFERRVVNVAAGKAATDAVNKAQLDAEAQARIAADVGLANDIATEAASRAQADATLNQRIANEEAARAQVAADLQSEANARAAADLALSSQVGTLGSRIDTLTDRVAALDARVDKLDRKVSASTAIAVAMGGNAFLPDMKFNLSANVATYGGAQAGSLQMGAMVSDHVAVNAGVATSFNKGGKAAGRVGFTVGW